MTIALNAAEIHPNVTNMSYVPIFACHGVRAKRKIVLRILAVNVAPTKAVPMI